MRGARGDGRCRGRGRLRDARRAARRRARDRRRRDRRGARGRLVLRDRNGAHPRRRRRRADRRAGSSGAACAHCRSVRVDARGGGGHVVSWQLASFALVLLALALALWWYERSQPTAKLLAVVATLAALAALGRCAFAGVPG